MASAAAAADTTPAPATAAPAAGGTPAATVSAGDAACEAAMTALRDGDLGAIEPDTAAAIARQAGATTALTCMAVAKNNLKYCDVLPKAAKQGCVDQAKLVGELKGMPKGAMKAEVLRKICLLEVTKEDCANLRDAIVKRDATLCEKLSTERGAWGRGGLCEALATGDAAKCDGAPEGDQRQTCKAMVTDDPKNCPKAAADCISMVGNFAAMKQGGLEGEGVDPVSAAATQGVKACEPLLSDLRRTCAAGLNPAAEKSAP